MKTLVYIVSCLIINAFFLKCRSQSSIRNIFFLPGSNIVTSDPIQRDGIVIIELNTGENTTICNYRFNDVQSGVLCKTLGFPAQGVSIWNNNPRQNLGPVLLSNFQCTGLESSIKFCSNSGRAVQNAPCNSHMMDVHVYCLFPKVPIIVAPVTVNTICNKTSATYQFIRSPGKRNIGLLMFNLNTVYYPVCNQDYTFDTISASIVCNQLCSNVTNPTPIESYSHPMLQNLNTTSVKLSCSGTTCTGSLVNCLRKSYLIGLQCGDDPIEIEKAPTVNCTNQNMTLSWAKNFVPVINQDLISLIPACFANTTNTTTDDAIMFIEFSTCQPAILTDEKFINFSYVVSRSYQSDGITVSPPKMITVICSFDRNAKPNNTLGLSQINTTLLNGTTTLPVEMTMYTDNSYTNPLLPLGFVDSNKQVFVKVAIKNPAKNVSLVLMSCTASTSNDFNLQNTSNSVFLIENACPNLNYDVIISPFNRSEIRFRFTPFKITSSASSALYVLCTTSLCYINNDNFCPYCARTRKRRSIYVENNINLEQYEVSGFLQLSNNGI